MTAMSPEYELNIEQLVEIMKTHKKNFHNNLSLRSIYHEAPEQLFEAIMELEKFTLALEKSRGKDDETAKSFRKMVASATHAYQYMIDISLISRENANLRSQLDILQNQNAIYEAELVGYRAIEQFMRDGTLDEKIELIKAKLSTGL